MPILVEFMCYSSSKQLQIQYHCQATAVQKCQHCFEFLVETLCIWPRTQQYFPRHNPTAQLANDLAKKLKYAGLGKALKKNEWLRTGVPTTPCFTTFAASLHSCAFVHLQTAFPTTLHKISSYRKPLKHDSLNRWRCLKTLMLFIQHPVPDTKKSNFNLCRKQRFTVVFERLIRWDLF